MINNTDMRKQKPHHPTGLGRGDSTVYRSLTVELVTPIVTRTSVDPAG